MRLLAIAFMSVSASFSAPSFAQPAHAPTRAPLGEVRDMAQSGALWESRGVQVGEHFDDLSLYSLEGKGTRVSKLWKDRPVLLVTASLTSPMARGQCPRLQSLIDAHGPEVRVVLLYTLEAHPQTDTSPYSPGKEWLTPENERSNILHRQPTSLEQRIILANALNERLKGVAPMFVDGMDNAVWKSLGGGPNMAVLIDSDGRVVTKQGWLDVDAMTKAVEALLDRRTASASGAYFVGKHARQRMQAFIEALQSEDLSKIDSFHARNGRLWTDQKSGEGVPVGVDAGRVWNQALNARRLIESAAIEANAVVLVATMVNDFDRLIEFTGERTRTTYWFDDDGRIVEELRQPLPVSPSMQACLKPAMEWAKANRARELQAIHPNNELLMTADAAKRWRALLNEWRAATGRTPITL